MPDDSDTGTQLPTLLLRKTRAQAQSPAGNRRSRVRTSIVSSVATSWSAASTPSSSRASRGGCGFCRRSRHRRLTAIWPTPSKRPRQLSSDATRSSRLARSRRCTATRTLSANSSGSAPIAPFLKPNSRGHFVDRPSVFSRLNCPASSRRDCHLSLILCGKVTFIGRLVRQMLRNFLWR
jgi:hypothetical protein